MIQINEIRVLWNVSIVHSSWVLEEEMGHVIIFIGLVVCFTENGRDLFDDIFALANTATRRQLGCVHKFGGERFGASVLFGNVVRHFYVVLTFNNISLQSRGD